MMEISTLFMLVGLVPFSCCSVADWNSTAKLNTRWTTSKMLPLFLEGGLMANFLTTWAVQIQQLVAISCGMLCSDNMSCVFSVYAFYPRPEISILEWQYIPRVLWSANRNRMVRQNATVEFTDDGNLILLDADDSIVWSTNTSNKGAVTMSLDSSSNLVLLDSDSKIVWQSFDHPTDVLTPGQVFKRGMRLIAAQYGSYSEGSYGMEIQNDLLVIYGFGSPQQAYFRGGVGSVEEILYSNTSLGKYFATDSQSFHYLHLQPNGNIQVHAFIQEKDPSWTVLYDLYRSSPCIGGGACGAYGVCTDGQCSCPQLSSAIGTLEGDAFLYNDKVKPELGCKSLTPLLLNHSTQHMIQVKSLDYFAPDTSLERNISTIATASSTDCKNICLQNPLCKLSVYRPELRKPSCYFFDRVYTLTACTSSQKLGVSTTEPIIFLKMQNSQHILLPPENSLIKSPHQLRKSGRWINLVIIFSSISGGFFLVVTVYLILRKTLFSPNPLQHSLSGIPQEFSYRQLQLCTKYFSRTLGHGGFATIFFGQIPGGISVAVKKLETAKKSQKQFEAEVCTIGSIHHVNLVKLHGFCAEGEHRLLVYEFMPNGSLDEWIFDDGSKLLDWQTRFSITIATAKGLAYLHDECRERIIHLDIKPQNILLDEQFVAKVSDFGLSKLVTKDETEIMTTMRGTPGYLAPEWLHSRITEKVDVYSFGIVLLEIVCGRRCIDYKCEDPSRAYLPAWVNKHVCEGNVVDVIDGRLKGIFDFQQAKRVLNVGLWCIQDDACVRPSMATVVEMLRGISDVEDPPVVHSNKLAKAFCEFVKSISV